MIWGHAVCIILSFQRAGPSQGCVHLKFWVLTGSFPINLGYGLWFSSVINTIATREPSHEICFSSSNDLKIIFQSWQQGSKAGMAISWYSGLSVSPAFLFTGLPSSSGTSENRTMLVPHLSLLKASRWKGSHMSAVKHTHIRASSIQSHLWSTFIPSV